MAIIILTNFSFILLCLNLPMAYIYGMEMQQKNAAERYKQMLKRPTTSDLSADATPFYPHFSQDVTTTAEAAEQEPFHAHIGSAGHSHIRQFLIENPVMDGDELLPNDPFDMDSPKLEKAHSDDDRNMIDGDIVQDTALMEQQQQQRDNLAVIKRTDQQIELSSSRKWIGETDVIDKEEAAQKWNTKNNEFVDIHHMQHQNPLQREDLSSNQKRKESIFLGENEEPKDGSSSERSPNNDVLEESRSFGEIKFENLDVSTQQVEFPDLSTLNQIAAVSNVGKTRQKQNIAAAATSKTTYKDKLKVATITKPTTTKTTPKKVPEQVQKGKEKMKEKSETVATKGKERQSNSFAIPAGVVEHPSVDGKKKKQGKSSSSGKSGTTTLLSVRQGNSPPPTKQAYAQGKIMMQQNSPPPQTPPDGAVVMRSRDRGDVVMTGANIVNPFEALWTVKQDESEVQFELPNTSTILPGIKPSSSSVASGSNKGKEIMTDKMIEKEQLKIFYSRIDSIVDLVHKLDQNKSKCMMLIVDEHQKDEQVSELMNDYLKIMKEMEEFSANYRKTDNIAYIGDIFNGMNKAYKASVIDHNRLTRIMQESLAYLDENLKSTDIDVLDLDGIFENIDSLKKFTISYETSAKSRGPKDPDTKLAKQEMMEWYENIVKGKIREVLSYLFLGLSSDGPDAYAQLTRSMLYMILTMFSQVLPSRQFEFHKARLTIDKYMEIMQGPDKEDQVKTKTDHIVEQYRDQLPKDIQEMNKRIEFVMEKIYELEEEKQKCTETDDYEERMARKQRLKLNYQFIMVLLTNFVRDYGQKYDKPRESNFFVDVLNWMAQLYVAKGNANNFNMTMKYCLQYLQNNEREEDVTKMEKLLQDIAKLKVDAEKCEVIAKVTGGYKNPETRAILHKIHQHFLEVVDPQLREAISYVFIGMRKRDGERVPKGKVALGLIALESVALPEYKDRIDVSNLTITALNIFWRKTSAQEIGENLTEYVTKILGIPFDAENEGDLEMAADKIKYPSIYQAGLTAIDEILKQLLEEEKKPTNVNLIGSSKSGAKKGKKKTVKNMVESGRNTDFGPINESNWNLVLNEARKMIRYSCILVMMQESEAKSEAMVYEGAIYLRAWTLLFRDELASLLDEWEATFYRMKNRNLLNETVSLSTIVKSYSDGIFNFVIQKHKGNEAKGKKIRQALERLSQLQAQYDMWHRYTHLRKWLQPDVKLEARFNCDCNGYDNLTND